jgi:hypothetical protein
MVFAESLGMMSSRLDDASKTTLRSSLKGNTRLQHDADWLNIHLYGALVDEAEENAALVNGLEAAN